MVYIHPASQFNASQAALLGVFPPSKNSGVPNSFHFMVLHFKTWQVAVKEGSSGRGRKNMEEVQGDPGDVIAIVQNSVATSQPNYKESWEVRIPVSLGRRK